CDEIEPTPLRQSVCEVRILARCEEPNKPISNARPDVARPGRNGSLPEVQEAEHAISHQASLDAMEVVASRHEKPIAIGSNSAAFRPKRTVRGLRPVGWIGRSISSRSTASKCQAHSKIRGPMLPPFWDYLREYESLRDEILA